MEKISWPAVEVAIELLEELAQATVL